MLLHKLEKQIEALQLNLAGKIVLTEAASGAYVVTPLLAALAGAEVYAFTRSTRYGTVEEVFTQTREAIGVEKFNQLSIHLIDELTPEIIAKADVITNSGHLRPLNKALLQHAKGGAVIPLMYEAWEWRDADLDIAYARERGLKVGATNERHPEVDVFNYLGDMALKQIFDAGLCPYRNKFVLLCNNDFGPFMARTLSAVAEAVGVIDLPQNKSRYDGLNVTWLSNFPTIDIPESFRDAEAIVFTAYPFDKPWIGNNLDIDTASLVQQFNDPLLLRYAGDVDTESLDRAGIRYFPAYVSSGHMGILPSAIGYDPIIRLQSGGLKAAEAMLTDENYFQGLPVVELI